jgi:hypothetical protein
MVIYLPALIFDESTAIAHEFSPAIFYQQKFVSAANIYFIIKSKVHPV